ncbi:MAG: hypothetical protein HXY40_08575 [Chloroflexi bacterium]|nr:hypothetical protein [Chloroflexota bacterium]
MPHQSDLQTSVLDWLLEPENRASRQLALRDLLRRAPPPVDRTAPLIPPLMAA